MRATHVTEPRRLWDIARSTGEAGPAAWRWSPVSLQPSRCRSERPVSRPSISAQRFCRATRQRPAFRRSQRSGLGPSGWASGISRFGKSWAIPVKAARRLRFPALGSGQAGRLLSSLALGLV